MSCTSHVSRLTCTCTCRTMTTLVVYEHVARARARSRCGEHGLRETCRGGSWTTERRVGGVELRRFVGASWARIADTTRGATFDDHGSSGRHEPDSAPPGRGGVGFRPVAPTLRPSPERASIAPTSSTAARAPVEAHRDRRLVTLHVPRARARRIVIVHLLVPRARARGASLMSCTWDVRRARARARERRRARERPRLPTAPPSTLSNLRPRVTPPPLAHRMDVLP